MKKTLSLTAALAVVLAAAPAMAQNRGVVVLTPGGSTSTAGVASTQQPTAFLDTETAQVLPDGLGYVSAGGSVGALPTSTLNYRRGMGGGGELNFGLGLNLGLNGPASSGGLGLGWKQALTRSAGMAVAFNGDVMLTGLGNTNMLGIQAGLPLTFAAGTGAFTVHPRLVLPALTSGNVTTGGTVEAALGFQAPLLPKWQLLADVVPTFGLGTNTFSLPIGVGARFSPSTTSHIDVSVGNLAVTPNFSGNIGLLNVTGHIGF